MQEPATEYTVRLESRRAALAREDRRHRRIGTLRFAVFAAALVMAWFAVVYSRVFSPLWLFVPAAVFVALVVVHSRVLAARRRQQRAVVFYERGLARLEDRWHGTGNGGDRFLDPAHPYAQDLDLFGKGSLFELLSITRTRAGEEMLARWLKMPATAEQVRARQAAVAELRPRLDLREDLAAFGTEIDTGIDPEALTAWGSAPPLLSSAPARIAAVVIALATVASLVVWGVLGDHRWFLLMALVEGLFTFRLRTATQRVVNAVERPGRDLLLLSQVLGRLEQESFQASHLKTLRAMLDSAGESPSRRIARLNRLIVLLDSARNQIFMPIAAVLLWKIHFAFAIEDWRQKTGPAIAGWLAAAAELEALAALAGYSYEHPNDPFPEICDEAPVFAGEGLGHPLISEKKSVRNDVHLGRALRTLIVSGSNMSGKSTLLRTIGTNAVLALAGAPVRARRLRLSPLAVGASIRTLDSLQEGSSRFYAEITRLRKLVDLAEGRPPLIFLLDELLNGTNSHDRRIGSEAVVQGLVRRGAIGLLTTHDLALAQIADHLAPRAANVHFEDHIENGHIAFDYRLRPGVVQKSNALELMRSIGLEV